LPVSHGTICVPRLKPCGPSVMPTEARPTGLPSGSSTRPHNATLRRTSSHRCLSSSNFFNLQNLLGNEADLFRIGNLDGYRHRIVQRRLGFSSERLPEFANTLQPARLQGNCRKRWVLGQKHTLQNILWNLRVTQ